MTLFRKKCQIMNNNIKKDYSEKTLTAQNIFDGKVIKLEVATIELPNGKTATREIVRHNGAVGVLAITEENKIIVVKQYRKALEQSIIEIPAGKLELDENPETCAIRELKEETGYTASNINFLHKFYTSPGFADEIIYLYQAKELIKGEAMPDEDEFVEILELSLTEIDSLVTSGQIVDAKTLVAVYYWKCKQP